MLIYNKESLERLRSQVDLVDLLSAYVPLKKSGASYKGLCPFHDEKSPSFIIQKGDTHYHCFGCGAHGDAIKFLMTHQKLSFVDAVESLAQRFHVHLEKKEGDKEASGLPKAQLDSALEAAADFYQFCLLHTAEGNQALQYLYGRGVDLDFIQAFQIGWSPATSHIFRSYMHKKGISNQAMLEAGLLSQTQDGRLREFFSERIMFPIHNAAGRVIGFSARKYREAVFGGKYINTSETALFKKSKVLFGLNHSRKRIAKERKAIIVEGQIDALRLIQVGFNITVAGQGTAFGEGHAKELLNLGLNQVFLALDADNAGQEATCKIGHLFQKAGVDVKVVCMPLGADPDSFLCKNGPEAFRKLLADAIPYINFLVKHLGKDLNIDSPSGKNELVQNAVKMIREWDHPLMVHETLRKLAQLVHVPEDIIGVGKEPLPNVYVRRTASLGDKHSVDPDKVLETDLLRWLLLFGQEQPQLVALARANLQGDDFCVTICRRVYEVYLENDVAQKPFDLLSLSIDLDSAEGNLLFSELLAKRVNKERAMEQLTETIQKILDRNWMMRREEIKNKIHHGRHSDAEGMELLLAFDHLKRNPPQVKQP